MRRTLLLVVLVALSGVVGLSQAPNLAAQTSTPRIQQIRFSTTGEWDSGRREHLIVTNNDDGELRLGENQPEGTFDTGLLKTEFPFNALGAVWRAEVPAATTLRLEVRGGPTPDELSDWQPLHAGDARSETDDGAQTIESVVMFPTNSEFLEFRAIFRTTVANASPVISEITFSYIDSTAGASQPDGLTPVPAPYGAATLTPLPLIIQRSDWAPAIDTQIARQTPRGILLHQLGGNNVEAPLPILRALAAFNTEVLGWSDVPFHFLIDQQGVIYEGRTGGPTAAVARLAGGDSVVHVALIGNGTPPAAQQDALVGLMAWLGEAYGIAPLGEHTFTTSTNATVTRPNITTHADAVGEAADPSQALRDLIGSLRTRADQATVRARWYFAEGNVHDYSERLSVLNPGSTPANVTFKLLRQPGPTVERTATIEPGGRAELLINSVFSDTTDVPAIIEANALIVAERLMDFSTDITAGPGIDRPSRVWYFAEGAVDEQNKTFLILFNPQPVEVSATITYLQETIAATRPTTQTLQQISQTVRIPPLQRSVVAVADATVLSTYQLNNGQIEQREERFPATRFGARVIATEPIIAERTMIFGENSSLNSGGVTTTSGVVSLSRRWYFAEGTTQSPFQMWVLVLNPNNQPTNTAVTFLTPDGTTLTRRYAIPPNTRLAINVNEVVPDLGVATTVEADRLIAAERAMYWNDRSLGTATAGAMSPAYTWRFADGRTTGEFQEYLLLSNPNKNQARVEVEFILANGTKQTESIVMPGSSRYTMAVHQLFPDQTAIGATVRATQPIVAERSLFPNDPRSPTSRGGATSSGVPEDLP